MKFKHKIWMLPLSAATFFAVGLLAGFWVSNKTADSLSRLRQVDYPYLQSIQRLDRDVDQLRLTLQSAASEGDRERLQEAWRLAAQAATVLQQISSIDGKADASRRLQDAYSAYANAAMQATSAILKRETSNAKVAQMQVAQNALYALLAAEISTATQATIDRQTEADKGLKSTLLVNLLTGLVVLLMLANSSALIVRSLWHDLGSEPSEIRTLMNDVAMGRLDVRPKVLTGDKTSITAGLRDMITRMAETMSVIRQVAENIKAAAELRPYGTFRTGTHENTVTASMDSTKARMHIAQADQLLEAVSAFKLP